METLLCRKPPKMGSTIRSKAKISSNITFPWEGTNFVWFANILFLMQIPDFAYSPNPHSECSIAPDSNLTFIYFVQLLLELNCWYVWFLLTQMGALGLTATTQKQNLNRKWFLAKLRQNQRHHHQLPLLHLLLKMYGYDFVSILKPLTSECGWN